MRPSTSPAPAPAGSNAGDSRHDWTAHARCAQTDPDLFFSDSASQTDQAKAICRRCAVREECLTRAVEAREEFGVWGGLDRDERRRLLRHRPADPRRTGAA